MKLSAVTGDRVFDVIADIIEPIATIAQDEDAIKLFASGDKPEDMTSWEYFVERAKTSIPVLMKKYKKEISEVLAALNGITVEEYVEGIPNPKHDEDPENEPLYEVPPLTIPKLFADVLDLVTDSEFVSFFS